MNDLKTAFWISVLTVLLVLVGRLVAGDAGMITTFALALLLNGFAYWFGDRIALSMARSVETSVAEAPDLHAMVERLAVAYGVPKPRVYINPAPTPNAFATGRSPEHAAVVVNRGLLDQLDGREIYAVLAHELEHIRNRDILISFVVAVLADGITILANPAQWTLWLGGAGGLVAILGAAVLAPLAATLVQLAISRSREYEADSTAARPARDPLALASALRELGETARSASPLAQPASAHLSIVNPLTGDGLGGLVSTHPPVEERIRRLERMAEMGPTGL